MKSTKQMRNFKIHLNFLIYFFDQELVKYSFIFIQILARLHQINLENHQHLIWACKQHLNAVVIIRALIRRKCKEIINETIILIIIVITNEEILDVMMDIV